MVGTESTICAGCNSSRRGRNLGGSVYAAWGGAPARRGRVKGLRRVTLTRVRYYLYYRVSGGILEVLAFWHTSRGRQPAMQVR